MIDFTLTTKPIEFVDNNSSHTPTSSQDTYRMTSDAHNKESSNSLTPKVDKVVPNLINPTKGLEEDVDYETEVSTSSGVQKFTFGIKQDSGHYFLTGAAADQTITVPLPRTLQKKNVFGEYADEIRAIYILMFCCFNLPFQFQSTRMEENGFKKLIKSIKKYKEGKK
jgi:ribosomal protein S6